MCLPTTLIPRIVRQSYRDTCIETVWLNLFFHPVFRSFDEIHNMDESLIRRSEQCALKNAPKNVKYDSAPSLYQKNVSKTVFSEHSIQVEKKTNIFWHRNSLSNLSIRFGYFFLLIFDRAKRKKIDKFMIYVTSLLICFCCARTLHSHTQKTVSIK